MLPLHQPTPPRGVFTPDATPHALLVTTGGRCTRCRTPYQAGCACAHAQRQRGSTQLAHCQGCPCCGACATGSSSPHSCAHRTCWPCCPGEAACCCASAAGGCGQEEEGAAACGHLGPLPRHQLLAQRGAAGQQAGCWAQGRAAHAGHGAACHRSGWAVRLRHLLHCRRNHHHPGRRSSRHPGHAGGRHGRRPGRGVRPAGRRVRHGVGHPGSPLDRPVPRPGLRVQRPPPLRHRLRRTAPCVPVPTDHRLPAEQRRRNRAAPDIHGALLPSRRRGALPRGPRWRPDVWGGAHAAAAGGALPQGAMWLLSPGCGAVRRAQAAPLGGRQGRLRPTTSVWCPRRRGATWRAGRRCRRRRSCELCCGWRPELVRRPGAGAVRCAAAGVQPATAAGAGSESQPCGLQPCAQPSQPRGG